MRLIFVTTRSHRVLLHDRKELAIECDRNGSKCSVARQEQERRLQAIAWRLPFHVPFNPRIGSLIPTPPFICLLPSWPSCRFCIALFTTGVITHALLFPHGTRGPDRVNISSNERRAGVHKATCR